MFCENCGRELEENAAFCSYCGQPIENSPEQAQTESGPAAEPPAEPSIVESPEEPPTEPPVEYGPAESGNEGETPPPKKKKGGIAKILIPVAVLAVIAVVGVVWAVLSYNSPGARMDRAIQARDLESAYGIFVDHFSSEDLSDKSIELLQAAATQIQDDYLSGEITYQDAVRDLEYIGRFGNSAVSETVSAALNTVQSQNQVASLLETARAHYEDREYHLAISVYGNVLSLDPSNAEAEQGLEQAKDAYRETVLSEADTFAAEGDFDQAAEVLLAAQQYLEEDSELADALTSLQDRQVEQMNKEVYAAADGGDWDGALELLDTYQAQYPDNQSLKDTRDDITKKMPITLKNLTLVSSEDIDVITSVVSDRWGDVYDGAVKYDASYDAYGLYNLNKLYTTFTGTVFVATEASTGKNMSVAIYLDEELAFYQDNITEETPPINLEIDVTGKTTMRIVTDNSGSFSSGILYFGNTNFAKAET